MISTFLKITLASLFAYLTFRDGVLDGNTLYAILFALLAFEYVVELLLDKRKS